MPQELLRQSRARLEHCRVRQMSSRCHRKHSVADRADSSTDNRAAHRRCGCKVGPCARGNCRPERCASQFRFWPPLWVTMKATDLMMLAERHQKELKLLPPEKVRSADLQSAQAPHAALISS